VDKSEIIKKLQGFKERLNSEVTQAFATDGSSYGRERFSAWRKQFTKFLDENLPGQSSKLQVKLHKPMLFRNLDETDMDVFCREDSVPSNAFIDSLILDVQNDEYEASVQTVLKSSQEMQTISNRVFIVHGHNDLIKTKVARFVERLGYEAVILHEQASKGMTIIEKIEANTDVGFAIVLYTPDDKGNSNNEAISGNLNDRARQNVVFEHGYLVAKLTRARVVPLVSGKVELPSDISGIVYVDDTNWQIDIAKEMKSVGYSIDFNKIIGG
jgi:predicted nucleotide-binding protein